VGAQPKPEERLPWWTVARLGEAGVRICSALEGAVEGMTTDEIVDHHMLYPSNDRTVQTALTRLHRLDVIVGTRDPEHHRRYIWRLLR
jgi:hypothetical protein